MSRTGLSAADLAEQFRDVCGDGSVEWVSMAWQTWVLLDAADMLDENDRLREQGGRLFGKTLELGTENAKLRGLVRDMWLHSYCSIAKTREDDDRHIEDVIDRMRELGVEP